MAARVLIHLPAGLDQAALVGQDDGRHVDIRARPVYVDPADGDWAGDWPGIFEDVLGAPVVLRSYGPTAAAKSGYRAPATSRS